MKGGQPYALAGLWEKWKDRKAGKELLTFTVITTDPNEVVQPLHDRMPVIIPERDYDRWLTADPHRPRKISSGLSIRMRRGSPPSGAASWC